MTVQHPKSGERTRPAGGGEANEGQGQRRAGKREAAALQAFAGGGRWGGQVASRTQGGSGTVTKALDWVQTARKTRISREREKTE